MGHHEWLITDIYIYIDEYGLYYNHDISGFNWFYIGYLNVTLWLFNIAVEIAHL
jgi:hypothetical protein